MPKTPPRHKATPKRVRSPQSAGSLLQRVIHGDALRAAQQGVEGSKALCLRLQAQLPEQLRPHVCTVIARPGELVVFTDAAVWAARLKLALAETPPSLAPELAASARVTVRVMPTAALPR